MKTALLVGNCRYDQAGLAELATPEEDVCALADVLKDPTLGGFDNVQLHVNCTFADFRVAVAEACLDRAPDDFLLIYYSGHGVKDRDGQLCLAARDTKMALLNATSYAARDLQLEMARCRAKCQALILDCCYSGAYSRGTKAAVGEPVVPEQFMLEGQGCVVLTASGATQFAWEGAERQGTARTSVFTRYIVQGMRSGEADTNLDGIVTIDELYEYVHRQVVAERTGQKPQKSGVQQGNVVIARNPRAATAELPLPQEVVDALGNPLAKVRAAAAEELKLLLRSKNRGLINAAYRYLASLMNDDSNIVRSVASAAIREYSPSVELTSPPTRSLDSAAPTTNILAAVAPSGSQAIGRSIQPVTVGSSTPSTSVELRPQSNQIASGFVPTPAWSPANQAQPASQYQVGAPIVRAPQSNVRRNTYHWGRLILVMLGVLLLGGFLSVFNALEPDGAYCASPCQDLGRCTRTDEACVATSNDECRRSNGCQSEGRCTAQDGQCRVVTDADCRQSLACRNNGFCNAHSGFCTGASVN